MPLEQRRQLGQEQLNSFGRHRPPTGLAPPGIPAPSNGHPCDFWSKIDVDAVGDDAARSCGSEVDAR
jgi:hypothetical protein